MNQSTETLRQTLDSDVPEEFFDDGMGDVTAKNTRARGGARHFWVLVHRYAGLYMAFFLIVAGVAGSFTAFYEELDAWLNPRFHTVEPKGTKLKPVDLIERAEQALPECQVYWVPLNRRPDQSLSVWMKPRVNPATDEPFDLDYGQVFLNPYTGEVLGSREWGVVSLTREHLMPFLYRLHYELCLPDGIGLWLFGIAAIIWTLDCFVAFYLTLPAGRRKTPPSNFPLGKGEGNPNASRFLMGTTTRSPPYQGGDSEGVQCSFWQRWKPAWKIKMSRLNFDLHRAGGLWTWAMLFVFAWSAVYLNLGKEVYLPVMTTFFEMQDPWGMDQPELEKPLEHPALSWRDALARGQTLMAEQARIHGFTIQEPAYLAYSAEQGLYKYGVKSDRDIGKHGSTVVMLDANTGAFKTLALPTGQHAGTTITTWLVDLHMAQVFGLPMQIFVCVMGLVIAMLSMTGVIIWWRKRRARHFHASRKTSGQLSAV